MPISVDSSLTLRSIGLLLGGAFAVACGKADPDAAATTMRDSSGVMIVQHDLTRRRAVCSIDSTPRVSIGVEDGEEPYMLARLGGAIRLSDGRIVIANRMTHEIRYFDSTGTFLRSSGRKGQGPGEFSDPFYIQPLRGDTIYVGDFRPFQYLVFDEKGNWVKSVKPDPMELNSPRSMNILADGRLFNGRSDSFDKLPNFAPRTMVMELYDANGKLTDTVATLENGRYGKLDDNPQSMYLYPIFESFAQARSRGDRIVIGHASKPELRVQRTDAGFPVDRIIRWDVGPRSISSSDVEAFKAAQRAQYADMPADNRARFLDPLISPARPVADSFPAFGQLMLASDSAIWIREFPRPTDTVSHHWIAFERDGAFRCRLDTPRFSEYLDWGRDYVLVADPDTASDVERVRLFRLHKP